VLAELSFRSVEIQLCKGKLYLSATLAVSLCPLPLARFVGSAGDLQIASATFAECILMRGKNAFTDCKITTMSALCTSCILVYLSRTRTKDGPPTSSARTVNDFWKVS